MNTDNEEYVVYGGTFDPFHQGHLSVLSFLRKRFSKIVLAPTSSNPWKDAPEAEFFDRLRMIELVLKAEKFEFSRKKTGSLIWLCEYPYVFSKDLATKLIEDFGPNLSWAVGADSAETVKNWKDWDALNIPLVVAPVEIKIHSEAIRAGKESLHPAITSFAAEYNLYRNS